MSAAPPAVDLDAIFEDADGPCLDATYAPPAAVGGDPQAVRILLSEDLGEVGGDLRVAEARFSIRWRKSDLAQAHVGGVFSIASGEWAGAYTFELLTRNALSWALGVVLRG